MILEKIFRYSQISKDAGKFKKFQDLTFNGVNYSTISQFSDETTSCEGNILIRKDEPGKIVVCFKGSVELKDWFRDAWIWKTKWPFSNSKGRLDGVKIHSGFKNQWSSVRSKVIRELFEIITDMKSHDIKPNIVFCGHSLGGALTSIAVLDVHETFEDQATYASYTCGSPRVYNEAGSAVFLGVIEYAYRTVFSNDIVPQMPVIGYKHVGKCVHVTKDFRVETINFEKPFIFCSPIDHFIETYVNALRFIFGAPGNEAIVEKAMKEDNNE